MSLKKKLVAFTGAGMSVESGLKTFRGHGGLWEGHAVQDVATPDAWAKDPAMVLRFYNERFNQLKKAEPNRGHRILHELETIFDVTIITQNVDDLHERAGSSNIIHLHGELVKCRSSKTGEVFEMNKGGLRIGDLCSVGAQLRPHIVWFGEEVPELYRASQIVETADVFIVIGSSLQVYPAASLLNFTSSHCRNILIDPSPTLSHGIEIKAMSAVEGLMQLLEEWKN